MSALAIAAMSTSIASAVVVPLGSGSAAVAAADPASAVPDTDHASGEAEARRIAAAHEHDVVVDDQSSPTLLVSAKPDGQMEAVSSQVPEQAQVGGRWKHLDSTLLRKGDWWEPTVAAVPVRIGVGGSADIVSVRSQSGEWITETWPYGALLAPAVTKDTAVFREVLPHVDLRVKITKAGMREVLVVKTPDAADDDRVASLRLQISGAALRVNPETDTVEAHTSEGEPVVAATPLWWDSSEKNATPETPGGDEPQAVKTAIAGAETVLDIAAIAHGDVTYPVYVDPDWSGYLQYDWFTDRAYPNQSYLNPPENSTGYGIQNGIGYLSRAFYRFDTAFLAGKVVSNARFNVVQNWANSCSSTWTQLWQYGPSNVGFTWNSDPAQWVRAIDAQAYNTGGPCSPNPAWVGFSATPTAQDAAIYSAPYITLALRAADEGNSLTRKHFRWDAQLIVTYNARPNVPTGASMISPNRGCSTDPNSPSYVGAQPLTLQVNASDPDPENVAANFYLTNATTNAETLLTTTPLQAQGSALRHTITPGTLTNGQKYSWSAVASDYKAVSSRTAPCFFVVDTTHPGLPSITLISEGGAFDANGETVDVTSPVGAPIRVHIAPPPGETIAGYQVWWTAGERPKASQSPPDTDYTSALPPCDGAGRPARIVCADASGAAELDVAPVDRPSTLWVAAYDRAGNVSLAEASASAGLTFRATNPDLSGGHVWAPLEPSVQIDDEVGAVPLLVGTTRGWQDDPDEDPQLGTAGLVSLNRYVKPGVSHWVDSGAMGTPGGHVLESTLGQLARSDSELAKSKGAAALYACLYGRGDMISLQQTCEGTGAGSRLLGYLWSSPSAVPAGFEAREIFRCRVGTDYFVSLSAGCEGLTSDGSRGFVAVHLPTKTQASVLDTTKTFSVSARVKPASVSGIQTVLATTSALDSAFYLQANGSTWRFCLRSQGPTKVTPCVNGPDVDTSRFVTVTGSWDAVNRVISLSVLSGQAFVTKSAQIQRPTDDVASTGVVTVGSATSQGYPSDFFEGAVADVAVYPALLTNRTLHQSPVPRP